jgi:hypothetical protein
MTEAFMKRGMERQQLLGGLMRDLLMEEERREDPTFLFEVGDVISEYLRQRRHNSPRHASREISEDISFCAGLILERIRVFSRSQVEDDALVAEMFRKIVESETIRFLVELQKKEFSDPRLIFHAPSAMAEVPIEGSG